MNKEQLNKLTVLIRLVTEARIDTLRLTLSLLTNYTGHTTQTERELETIHKHLCIAQDKLASIRSNINPVKL